MSSYRSDPTAPDPTAPMRSIPPPVSQPGTGKRISTGEQSVNVIGSSILGSPQPPRTTSVTIRASKNPNPGIGEIAKHTLVPEGTLIEGTIQSPPASGPLEKPHAKLEKAIAINKQLNQEKKTIEQALSNQNSTHQELQKLVRKLVRTESSILGSELNIKHAEIALLKITHPQETEKLKHLQEEASALQEQYRDSRFFILGNDVSILKKALQSNKDLDSDYVNRANKLIQQYDQMHEAIKASKQAESRLGSETLPITGKKAPQSSVYGSPVKGYRRETTGSSATSKVTQVVPPRGWERETPLSLLQVGTAPPMEARIKRAKSDPLPLKTTAEDLKKTQQALNMSDAPQVLALADQSPLLQHHQLPIQKRLEQAQTNFKTISSDVNEVKKRIAGRENLNKEDLKAWFNKATEYLAKEEIRLRVFLTVIEQSLKKSEPGLKADFEDRFFGLKKASIETLEKTKVELASIDNCSEVWKSLAGSSADKKFQADFLLTYRNVIKKFRLNGSEIPGETKSAKLFNLFSQQFKEASESEKQDILNLTTEWLKDPNLHGDDAKIVEVQSAITSLISQIDSTSSKELQDKKASVERLASVAKLDLSKEPVRAGNASFGELISAVASGKIKKRDYAKAVATLATDLTAPTIHLMSEIKMSEFDSDQRKTEESTKKIPSHIEALVAYNTDITNLVTQSIISQKNLEEATRVLTFFIDVQSEMISTPPLDLTGALALQAAFEKTIIEGRITESSRLPSQQKNTLAKGKALFDPAGSYVSVRQYAKSHAVIPSIQVCLSDMEKVVAGNEPVNASTGKISKTTITLIADTYKASDLPAVAKMKPPIAQQTYDLQQQAIALRSPHLDEKEEFSQSQFDSAIIAQANEKFPKIERSSKGVQRFQKKDQLNFKGGAVMDDSSSISSRSSTADPLQTPRAQESSSTSQTTYATFKKNIRESGPYTSLAKIKQKCGEILGKAGEEVLTTGRSLGLGALGRFSPSLEQRIRTNEERTIQAEIEQATANLEQIQTEIDAFKEESRSISEKFKEEEGPLEKQKGELEKQIKAKEAEIKALKPNQSDSTGEKLSSLQNDLEELERSLNLLEDLHISHKKKLIEKVNTLRGSWREKAKTAKDLKAMLVPSLAHSSQLSKLNQVEQKISAFFASHCILDISDKMLFTEAKNKIEKTINELMEFNLNCTDINTKLSTIEQDLDDLDYLEETFQLQGSKKLAKEVGAYVAKIRGGPLLSIDTPKEGERLVKSFEMKLADLQEKAKQIALKPGFKIAHQLEEIEALKEERMSRLGAFIIKVARSASNKEYPPVDEGVSWSSERNEILREKANHVGKEVRNLNEPDWDFPDHDLQKYAATLNAAMEEKELELGSSLSPSNKRKAALLSELQDLSDGVKLIQSELLHRQDMRALIPGKVFLDTLNKQEQAIRDFQGTNEPSAVYLSSILSDLQACSSHPILRPKVLELIDLMEKNESIGVLLKQKTELANKIAKMKKQPSIDVLAELLGPPGNETVQ